MKNFSKNKKHIQIKQEAIKSWIIFPSWYVKNSKRRFQRPRWDLEKLFPSCPQWYFFGWTLEGSPNRHINSFWKDFFFNWSSPILSIVEPRKSDSLYQQKSLNQNQFRIINLLTLKISIFSKVSVLKIRNSEIRRKTHILLSFIPYLILQSFDFLRG